MSPVFNPRHQGAITPILAAVSAVWRVPVMSILSHDRHKTIAEARCAAYWLARRLTRMSYPEIALMMHKHDHTTVIAGARGIDRKMKNDEWLRDTMNALLAELATEDEKVIVQ